MRTRIAALLGAFFMGTVAATGQTPATPQAGAQPSAAPGGRAAGHFSKYIEPSDVLGEGLFGLIMVLTFTLGAGIALGEGEETVGTLLIAALGCNLAWGIIDGAMYVMNAMFNRGRMARVFADVKRAGEPAALATIARELDSGLTGLMTAEERSRLHRSILDVVLRTPITRTRIEREDIYGGLACATVVFFTALPAAVPFMLIGNPQLALRVSNGILIAMLFGLGYQWARHTNASRMGTGLALMLTGLALVGAAMALGG